LARVSIKRQKEVELHRDLREMRAAIDAYKDAVTSGQIGGVSVTGTDAPTRSGNAQNGVVAPTARRTPRSSSCAACRSIR
jgi:hypothetical protein